MAFLQVDVCLAGHQHLRGIRWHCDGLTDRKPRRAVVMLQADVSSAGAIHVGAVDAVDLQHLARAAAIAQCCSHRGSHRIADRFTGDRRDRAAALDVGGRHVGYEREGEG